jgi:hypothetical protein
MVAELGNFFLVVPYMCFVIAGITVIFIAMRDRKPPSMPNLTARRKHPLRHLQVELNKARKAAPDPAPEEQSDGKSGKGEEKPPRPRRGGDGPRLRRLK